MASSHFLNSGVIGRLSALPLESRRPMSGSVSGRHRSQNRGSSIEFSEYRKYVPGDDTRRLDWRAWGRNDRFYVKEFEADTNLRLCLVTDVSGSMNYPLTQPVDSMVTRLDYARQLAGTLAWLASKQGEAVGLSTLGEMHRQEVQPKRGARHLGGVLNRLAQLRADGESDLVRGLHAVADLLPRRSMVVVISDLLVEPETLQAAFEHLRWRGHDVIVFHLLDPQEISFDFDRPVKLVDMETGDSLLADPALMRQSYQEVVENVLVQVREIMIRAQVDYHKVSLDQTYEQVLTEFLLGRR
jgi:uncharacterized protein (DUF58 family)